MDHHEIDGRGHALRRGSDRSFGFTLAAALAVLGGARRLHGGKTHLLLFVVAASLLVLAVARPRLLRPLAGLWFRLGLALHRLTSPIVLGAIFFLVVTPTGLLLRLCRRDPLRLQREPGARTYWLERAAPDPGARWMQRQF